MLLKAVERGVFRFKKEKVKGRREQEEEKSREEKKKSVNKKVKKVMWESQWTKQASCDQPFHSYSLPPLPFGTTCTKFAGIMCSLTC
jgi:hypothetical protein